MKKYCKFLLLILCFLFSFVLTSCSENESNDSYGIDENTNNVVIDTTRKMYYTVEYYIEAEDITNIKKEINSKVDELNGYIQTSSNSNNNAKYVYRIPTDSLNLFLDFIDAYGESINEKKVKATDITSSYSQVEARKEVLAASRAAYLKILESNELTVSEIISIQDKLSDIDTEMLKIEKELSSYINLIDYSTITIEYEYDEPEPGFFKDYFEYLGELFVFGGKAFMYLLPFICVGGIIIAVIVISSKVRKKKNNSNNKNDDESKSNNLTL